MPKPPSALEKIGFLDILIASARRIARRNNMVLPLYADDPLEGQTRAYVTWGLIAINTIVFFGGRYASCSTAGIFGDTPGIYPNRRNS